MVISRDELAELSPAERQELLQQLIALGGRSELASRDSRRRRAFLVLVGVSLVVLAAWVVTLGVTLPRVETITQWRTAWVGFDVGLLGSFAVTGWAAWRGRQLLVPALLVTGTLLLCDAWFDVVLSWDTDERWWSVISAAALEVPLAILFAALSRRLVLRTVALARSRFGLPGPVPSMSAMMLFDPLWPTGPARGYMEITVGRTAP